MTGAEMLEMISASNYDPDSIVIIHDTVGIGSGPVFGSWDLDCPNVLILRGKE